MLFPPSTKVKPCFGFVLHFGYVESGKAGMLILHHCAGLGFDTVEEGARDLAKFFLDDYLRETASHNRFVSKHGGRSLQPSLEDFQERLLRLSDAVADNWVDGEEWWVWDSLRDVYPHLGSFWENTGCEDDGAEVLFPRYLNIDEDVPAEWSAFREELAKDRAEVAAWLESMKLKEKAHFVKVVENV